MSSPHTGADGPDRSHAPAPSRLRGVLTAGLAVVLVLAVVAGGYLLYRSHHLNDQPLNPFSGESTVPSETERHDASAVAEQFALRMDNVDGTKFDAYVAKIEQLLTTKAKSQNKQVFDAMGKTYAAAKIKGTGKVLLSGVGDIDSDSASVLVAHDATVTTSQGNLVHHYRWTVDLVKVKGTWLVDSFAPVS